MQILRELILTILLVSEIIGTHAKNKTEESIRKFPDNLIFGAATASYQVEGAWDEDGKTESIWDRYTHSKPCATTDCRNGDVAADSYHNVERDVEMMRELGLDFYRFSLSWPRILPTGFPDQINEAGVAYYNKLIDEMLKYNIQPAVTIYHWDLPQKLQEMGGWLNPHMVDWFGDYARVAYELFGDRVKYWTTINEPNSLCMAYENNDMAATSADGHGWYLCARTLVLAHARAYHIYNDDFKPTQNGIMGIVVFMWWEEPETESEDDLQAVEESHQFSWGIFFHPIYSKEGDFPSIVKEKVAAKSAAQGFPRSRLPELTNEEIEYIRGTADYFGMNHYTTRIVYRNSSVYGINQVPSLEDDVERGYYQSEEWPTSKCVWTKRVPRGFYNALTKVRDEFDNMPVFILENGFCTYNGLDDDDRVSYYKEYLGALLDAIEDGCNVIGYTAWSMMDNFEWNSGYTHRFGLYEVDFERSERTRTPRRSAFVYKEILRTRTLDPDYQPDTTVMTIDEGH